MKKPRVILEPELEEKAALWTVAKRIRVARRLERWARQLRVSAKIISDDLSPQRPRGLKLLVRRRAELN